MAERDVDELFGESPGERPRPRLVLATALLIAGWAVVVFGLLCSVIPGLLVLAWAWNVVETDWQRVQNGYYGVDQRRTVLIARIVTYIMLVLGMGALIAQWYLLDWGFYHALWSTVIERILAAVP